MDQDHAKKPVRPMHVVGAVLGAVALGVAIFEARYVLILGFFSLLLATLMSYPVDFFSKKIARGLAVVLTLFLFAGVVAGMGALIVPVVSRQVDQLSEQIPRARATFDHLFSGGSIAGPVVKSPQGRQIAAGIRERAMRWLGDIAAKILPAAVGAVSLVSTLVLLVVLAAFLVYNPRQYRLAVRRLVLPAHEAQFDELWSRLSSGLRHWMAGIVVSMTTMGAFAMLGLWIAGIEGWFTLGLLTFFGTFIPYAGALASAIPGLIVGLSMDVTHFFYAAIVYLGVHVVEGYIIEPAVMRRAVELKPATLLFWQALTTAIFGILGIIVATPLLVTAKIIVGYLYVEEHLGRRDEKEAA